MRPPQAGIAPSNETSVKYLEDSECSFAELAVGRWSCQLATKKRRMVEAADTKAAAESSCENANARPPRLGGNAASGATEMVRGFIANAMSKS